MICEHNHNAVFAANGHIAEFTNGVALILLSTLEKYPSDQLNAL